MLLRRLKYPGTSGLIFRKTWSELKENHLEEGYFKLYPFMRDWYNATDHVVRLPNNSVIYFRTGDKPGAIDDFLGRQYMDILIDEATQLAERELQKLTACNRWPGMPESSCKTVYTMNPGGPGHAYMRRVMILRKDYHENERPQDYTFLQAYAWDNVEWARGALAAKGLTEEDYYAWSDRERFEFCIRETQYGRDLNALPQALRIGWLLGDWKQFAGQYFDCFDLVRHVVRCQPDREWHPRWIGGDWGFAHDSCFHWMARPDRRTCIYREFCASGRSPRALAQEVVDRTPEDERELIDAIYLSPDAFQHRTEQDSIAEQMGDVFAASGMPRPVPADDDRIHGAALMYELLRNGELEIDPSCEKLIDTIPMVTRDEDEPEDTVKFDGDDPYDSARYGLKSRERAIRPPVEERITSRITAYAARQNKSIEQLEPTALAMLARKAQRLERPAPRFRKFRPGRPYQSGLRPRV